VFYALGLGTVCEFSGRALVGTTVGATVAFWIEGAKRRQRLEDEHIVATNVALYELSRAWRDLELFRQDRIAPVRNTPEAWYTMVPGEVNSPPSALDVTGLAFLFEGDHPDLPAQVHFEIERFGAIRKEIENRSAIHVRDVQPRVEKLLSVVGQAPETELIRVVGPRLYDTLFHQTKLIISEVDTALPSIRATAQRLRAAVLAEYPNRKIIRFEPRAGAQVPTAGASSP